jgi:chemotaxis protein CheX
MKHDPHAPFPTFALAEVLDLKAAAPLASSLLTHRGHELAIDTSRVRRLGGQCLQILLSAQSTWQADEVSLEFINPSSEFIEALESFGISPEKLLDQEMSHE